MDHIKYFHYTITFFHGLFKIVGLKPPANTKSIAAFLYYTYSMAIFIGFILYNKSVSESLNISTEFHGRKTGLPKLYIDTAYIMSMTMFAITYLYQNKNILASNRLEERVKFVVEKINMKIGDNHCDFKKGLTKFLSVIIFMNFAYAYGVALKLQLGGIVDSNLVLKGLLFAFPTTIIAVTTDYYCGGMLFFGFYFKQLNRHIKELVVRSKELIDVVENRVERKYQFMLEFCELSDKLDELSILHEELCDVTLRFNELWQKQICAYTLWRSYIFLAQLYMEFIFIRFSMQFSDDYSDWHMHSFVMLFNQIVSILKITFCCSSVTFQVMYINRFTHP